MGAKRIVLMSIMSVVLGITEVLAQTCPENIDLRDAIANANASCNAFRCMPIDGPLHECHIQYYTLKEEGITILYLRENWSPCYPEFSDYEVGGRIGALTCGADFMPISSVRPPKQPICHGSIIKLSSQTLGESLPIVGSSFNMEYYSDRTVGNVGIFKAETPVTTADLKTGLSSIQVTVLDENSNVFDSQTYSNIANQTHTFIWNGLDHLSNPVHGGKKFKIRIKEQYSSYDFTVANDVYLGTFLAKKVGLGGWLPSVYSFYDHQNKTIYFGDGQIRSVKAKDAGGGLHYIASEDGKTVSYYNASGNIVSVKTGLLGTQVLSFTYDGSGKLLSIGEPFGKTTAFNYDGSGNFQSITAANGSTTLVTLDSNGYLASFTNPQSETHSMSYSSAGLLLTFTKPKGEISTFQYDSDGLLIKDSHSGGYFVDLVQNLNYSFNREVSLVTPMSRTTTVRLNDSSTENNPNLYFQTESRGSISEYQTQYSGGYGGETESNAGLSVSRASVSDARFGDMSPFIYDLTYSHGYSTRNVASTQNITLSNSNDPFSITSWTETSGVSGGPQLTTTVFNPATKKFTSTSVMGKSQELTIDLYERPVSYKQGSLDAVQLNYTNENLTSIVQNTRTTSFAYHPTSGFLTSITNPLSQTTSYSFDSAGRLSSITLPDSRVISYLYNVNGDLTRVTPPGRPGHNFSYDAKELVSAYSPPTLTGVSVVDTTYAYNNDKQITKVTRPNSEAIDYYYDTVGNLSSFATSEGTFIVTQDTYNQQISSIVKPDGSMTNMTWASSDLMGYENYDDSFNYMGSYYKSYGINFLITSDAVTGNTTSTINYLYNNDEDLRKAGDINLYYNTPNGQLTGTSAWSGGNQITDSYTYNSYGEVTGYQASRGSTVLYTLSLDRDGMGRINGKTEVFDSATHDYDYTFDSTGRLIQTDKNSSTYATYSYDSNSNRTGGVINGATTTATYNNQDWMTAYNALTFTYDANGDLTSKTNTVTSTTTTYTYDVFGNLRQVNIPPSTVITYEIDGLNRRVGKKVNGIVQKRWVYMDQYRIAAELNAAGNITKRFIYGSKSNIPDYMVAGGVKYRIISDHLGSPRLVVRNNTGAVIQKMNHDEFGRVTEDTNPGYLPFGFAGGLYDHQTGLVRFGARDYDSETGRWTSKDPILFGGGDTNLYGYVTNDPVNWVDPDGLKKTFVFQNGNLSFYDDNGGLLFDGPAKSGPWGNGGLPKGNYSVGGMRDNRSGSYACSGSGGYSLDLHPQFPTNRTDLRIHPDGGTPGTLGCIGVNCGNGAADALGEMLRGIYGQPMTPWIGLEVR